MKRVCLQAGENATMKREYPAIDMSGTGRTLKQIMLIRGMTVKDVQAFLGLATPQAIYHWFDGRSLPALDNLYALSELFRVPVDTMLRGNRKYSPAPLAEPGFPRLYMYFERLARMRACC